MDNKITKPRLSVFLSYEWIAILVVCLVMILPLELIYAVTSVKLNPGQQFKYYYDEEISATGNSELYMLISDGSTFSYDVIEIESESLLSSVAELLSARLSIQEGDIIITTKKLNESDNTVRAKTLIDGGYYIGSLDKLNSDGIQYLKGFLKDEFNGKTEEEKKELCFNYDNLDDAKIIAEFISRNGKDNRFRTEEQKQQGYAQERERIKKLCKDISDFDYIISIGDSIDLFFNYQKFAQSYENATKESDKANYESYLQKTTAERYGINVSALDGGENKHEPSEFFKSTEGTAENLTDNIVIMYFDFYNEQKGLQFETTSFFVKVIRSCSTLLDARS